MAILNLEQVSFFYQSKYQRVQAVKQVSFAFEPGRFYAVMGKSGSGKSTLLALLAGLEMPQEGQVLFQGQPTSQVDCEAYPRDNPAVIYQSYNLFPLLTAEENAAYGLRLKKVPKAQALETARQRLAEVGLEQSQFGRMPAQLSGGEQQRVAIARALATGSEIVLADEPTGNLDESNTTNIVSILAELAREKGRCVIVVTHDPAVAQQADQVLRMQDGQLVEQQEA